MKKNLTGDAQPFPIEKQTQLKALISDLHPEHLYWIHGYMEGLLSKVAGDRSPGDVHAVDTLTGNTLPAAQEEITLLFGSHTGNSKKIAHQFLSMASSGGLKVKLMDLNDYRPQSLPKEKMILLIVSTHGEGDPPLSAEDFYHYLHSKRAPRLDNLRYSILALGDRSYINFCKTGVDIDKRLQELGGKSIVPRTDCDVDFEDAARTWISRILKELTEEDSAVQISGPRSDPRPTMQEESFQASRAHPAQIELAEIINLNGRGSTKETFHIELLGEDKRLGYQPGDALAVFPENDPELVEQVLQALKLQADTSVDPGEGPVDLKHFLSHSAEISIISRDTLERFNELAGSAQLSQLLEEPEKLKNYLWGRDLLDLIREFPSDLSAEQWGRILRKLQPRLYSLASSPLMFPGEFHITVASVRYHAGNRLRKGACSSFLSYRVNPGDLLKVYIESHDGFRLPKDPDTPIIMVGPGTGIAPFRAFMQEREMAGSRGKNWLFYGDRHFTTDFLYQTEWQQWHKKGLLNRFDLAFSRDQKKKVYVQDKLAERSKELYGWIQEGASLYVCGDAQSMAKGVRSTLIQILMKEADLSEEKAKDYFKSLQKQKRYLEDVY